MEYVRKLPSVEDVRQKLPLPELLVKKRLDRIRQIQGILSGKDSRKLLIIGPCSADREDAVIDYCKKLAGIEKDVRDRLLIVPRVYTGKPRTKGTGYKGMIHRPHSESDHDDLEAGLIASRKMHLDVILETGFFCADEMLYPDAMDYFVDLLAYVAVGARSVEDQYHRLTASGLEIPVGMKNPMDGNLSVMLNSVESAQQKQSFIYREWVANTNGNPFAHAILRGYVDRSGQSHPNYHFEDIVELHDLYRKSSLKNMAVIIDCNHSNSKKIADAQLRIVDEVNSFITNNDGLHSLVKGFMVESYLVDGKQIVGGGVYGKSITDACIGWEKTEKLIEKLAK